MEEMILSTVGSLRHMGDRAHLFWKLQFVMSSPDDPDPFFPYRATYDEELTKNYEPDLRALRSRFYESPRFIFDREEIDDALLFDAESPLADLIPALAANAVLTLRPSFPGGVPAQEALGPAYYTSPTGEDMGVLAPSEIRSWTALWQLESLGWIWDDARAEAKRAPTGRRGHPKTLRNHAIETLSRAWSPPVEADDKARIMRIRLALRWFFRPKDLTDPIVGAADYRSQ